ncbi:MAG: M20/M25/M40 family metallo-hydrolase, partial [Proteobacteria bacterium]|nr:M20/M25/M40 family metallo-hydrolase [Pseudomonadota bacterium]
GDPRIQTLVDQVDKSNLSGKVNALSSQFTRRADSAGAVTAQGNIQGWLNGFGLSTSTQQFNGSYSHNVIAEIPGSVTPEKIIVLGAHYDSVNWADGSSATAPGADDNASGTSGVIEAARVLAQGGPYENTLRFVLFSGEELGLLGSDYNAAQSQAAGEQIVAMLNMDMIAYRAPGDTRDVDFATNNTSSSLTGFCDATSAIYVPNWASTSGVLTAGSSDHASYNSKGFPAAFFFEDLTQYYFNIHTATDTMAQATTDFDLAKMIVQGVVASAASLAEPVDMTLTHATLGDSLDGVGPYLVSATVTSQTAASVSSVTLHHSTDGVNFTAVAMADAGGGLYEGLIPGGLSPVTVSYWIEALDSAGGSEIEPAGADLGGAPHSFFVGQKTVVYSTDFEGGSDGGWTHGMVATQDDWQRG